MSSFSSVVHKTGTNIRPRAQPRRNVPRQVERSRSSTAETTPHSTKANHAQYEQGKHPLEQSPNSGVEVQNRPAESHISQSSITGTSVPTVRSTGASRLRGGRAVAADSARSILNGPETYLTDGQNPDESTDIEILEQNPSLLPIQPSGARSVAQNTNAGGAPIALEESHVHQASDYPNKRRKTTPRSAAISAPTSQSAEAGQSQLLSTFHHGLEHNNNHIQPQKDLFRLATEQAASVSSLAHDIETQTRARSQQNNIPGVSNTVLEPSIGGKEQLLALKQSLTKSRKKSAAEQAAEIIASIAKGSGEGSRKRNSTPDGAEEYELEPDQVTMGDLTRDRKLGKKSQLEEDMQRDWADIVKRRKEAKDLALENARKGRRKAFGNTVEVPVQATIALGPRTEVRNGRIVVIEESRQIDRNGALEQAAVLDAENVREDKFYYKRVNQNTVGMKAHAGRKFRWDPVTTEQFFKGLQMFGTDFLMIANMFPGLDRKQVKMKFIREENADKMKVREALANKVPIDLEEYAKITDTKLQDPDDLQAEIDAEEERLKEEDHQRRVREGFVNTTAADNPIPTTEGEDTAVVEGTAEPESRFAAMAEEIMAPKKRQRKTGSTLRKRGPKAGRRPAEGIEEVLGSIDEVRV